MANLAGLTANTTYYVRILAKGDGITYSDSDSSVNASATTAVQPAVPANLRSTSIGKTALQLEWNKVTGATQYVLQRKGPSDSDFVTIYTGSDAKYSDTNREVGTTYQYQIQATNDAGGISRFSTAINVKTLANDKADVPIITKAELASGNATLQWTNLGTDYDSYVFRNGTLVAAHPKNKTSYVDNNPGTTTEYYVYVYNKLTQVWSNAVPIVLSSNSVKAEILGHTTGTNGAITVNWDIPAAAQFVVFRNGIAISNNFNGKSYTDTTPRTGANEYVLYVGLVDNTGRTNWTWSSPYIVIKSTQQPQMLSVMETVWSDFDFIDELEFVQCGV